MKVFYHPPYLPDLSPCDFFLLIRLMKMLSGNKYTSKSSPGSAIYQCLQQIPKEDYLSGFSRLGKKVTKMCFRKGGILWRFVIKICLIKRSTEVTRTQWQNVLQDPCITTMLWLELFFFFFFFFMFKHSVYVSFLNQLRVKDENQIIMIAGKLYKDWCEVPTNKF